MKKRSCLFCCSPNNQFTKEHVIAQWLLKEVDIYDDIMSMNHVNFVGLAKSERVQVFNKLVNGLVCVDCNGGWMSDLENENKDGIIKLMAMDTLAIDFVIKNHSSLAKWIFKKVIL